MTAQEHLKRLDIEVDNYQQTVLALRAFANELLFDDQAREPQDEGSAHCGRKFRTSANNRHSPCTDVFPDLAIVMTSRYGVIAEAKLGFDSAPKGFDRRIRETVEQMEKYDDDLTGWPRLGKGKSSTIAHDLTLIINFEDAKRAVQELQNLIQNRAFCLTRKLAIVSIARIERSGGVWPTLTLEHGKLSDPAKTKKLNNRVLIRPEVLDTSPRFGQVRLYDHVPPIPLMMHLIHKAIVENLTPDEQEQYNLEGQVDKRILLTDLQKWISLYAFNKTDARDPLIPKIEWFKKAITRLVDMGWAERYEGNQNEFMYHHKKSRKGCTDPLGRFTEVYAKHLAKAEEKKRKEREKEENRKAKRREKLKEKTPLFTKQIDKDLS